ncbi:hypothetical protein Tco_1356009 [Tanacetum coccineum]
MKIPNWMITDEMKLIENYRMYAAVFSVDVPKTQSQSIESTKGMHRRIISPSSKELEAKQNKEKVKEYLMAEEIEKLVKGTENVEEHEVDSSTLRQDDNQNDPGTRLKPRSNKESPKVEITVEVQPVNVNEEE